MTCGQGKRPLTLLLLVLLLSMGTFAKTAKAQATGELLCSAGSKDGKACQTHADCPGGACVIAQGVCNDGSICDCPGGTCSESTDLCSGGARAGQTCDSTFNCASGTCQGTQKVCVGGSSTGTLLGPGFSCLSNAQCDSSHCNSTGLVCAVGSDYVGYSCGRDADCCAASCPAGACYSPGAVPTPTPTASRTGTAVTPTPSPSANATPRPTSPPHRTAPPQGELFQAIGEGAGCATAADGTSRSAALLMGAIGLWVARRRWGA